MALDAAGTSVDEVLKDATRRQECLNTYENGKKKQVEEFEAAKSRENIQIEEEMERVRAHYSERIQHNRDVVTQEKEGLRNWQMAMQHEIQRIAEVIDLCNQTPAPPVSAESKKTSSEPNSQAQAATAGRTG
jgi:translation elongation factor EF-Ts